MWTMNTKRRSSGPGWPWAGTDVSSRRWALAALCCAITVAAAVSAAPAGDEVELRVTLPAGVPPEVAVAPENGRILLDLPAGSELPLDVAGATGGLLTGARVERRGERLAVELGMGRGTLVHVAYAPGEVVLVFRPIPEPVAAAEPLDFGRESPEEYRLGPEDRIAITVHNQPDLSSKLTLSADGIVSMPLLGEMRATGLSSRQLAARLEAMLGSRFLVDPRVDVQVEAFRSQWVVVAGEVDKPGRISLTGGTRLKEVLGEAGGFRPEAGEEIRISRRGDDGVPVTLEIEREEFERGRVNPVLAHGDIIEVGQAKLVYLQGEVRSAGPQSVRRGLTLMKAISQAGGLTEWADRKNIRILHYDRGRLVDEDVVSLRDIERRKAEDPMLRGDEVVLVRRRFL